MHKQPKNAGKPGFCQIEPHAAGAKLRWGAPSSEVQLHMAQVGNFAYGAQRFQPVVNEVHARLALAHDRPLRDCPAVLTRASRPCWQVAASVSKFIAAHATTDAPRTVAHYTESTGLHHNRSLDTWQLTSHCTNVASENLAACKDMALPWPRWEADHSFLNGAGRLALIGQHASGEQPWLGEATQSSTLLSCMSSAPR